MGLSCDYYLTFERVIAGFKKNRREEKLYFGNLKPCADIQHYVLERRNSTVRRGWTGQFHAA